MDETETRPDKRQSEPEAPLPLSFKVTRNGTHIGEHKIVWRQEDGILTAFVAVDLVVRLGFIPVYRYKHSVRETWRDGRFATLDSETNDNGKKFQVRARSTEAGVTVESGGTRAVLAPEAIPLTHWNPSCMERPLFNPQDGALLSYRIEPLGDQTITLGDGRKVMAAGYTLAGKNPLESWYDRIGIWSALRSKAHDGSVIEYRRSA